jgi:poly(A) polymerase
MSPLPNQISDREDAQQVLLRLRQAGHIAYFAGGCVRDVLLGLTPEDWDVATDAPPSRVRELFNNSQAVGAAFGVILVRQGRSVIEVATFRSDLGYTDGRRPHAVQFTTAQADARRRDFTINGLFFDPLDNRVIDYVGGQDDLKARLLRAIGNPDERFAEDHLRLLRAVRFAARFGLQIEPTTATAIASNARHLPRISPERIADELRRTLTAPARAAAWITLWDLSLNPQLFRLLPATGDSAFDPNPSIFLALNKPSEISFGLALAVATLDYQWQRAGRTGDIRGWLDPKQIAKTLRAMRQSLKISNEEGDDLQGTLAGAGAMLADTQLSLAAKKRFLASPTASNSRYLLDSFAVCGFHTNRIASLQAELAELEKTEFAPQPLITGDDLATAGLPPGPAFKIALQAAYDAQLEGRVASRDEALKLAMAAAGDMENGKWKMENGQKK